MADDEFLDTLEDALTGSDDMPSAQRATEIDPEGYVSSGNLWVNWAVSGKPVSGGYPIGKITSFAGDSFTGKTALAHRAIAMAQQQGGLAFADDTENAWGTRMESLGVDRSRLTLTSSNTVREHHEAVQKFLDVVEKNDVEGPLLVILDSLGDLTTAQEQDHGLETQTVGAKAKAVKKHLRIVGNRLADLDVSYIIIRHVFRKINAFGDPRQAGGGEGPSYRASVRILLNQADETDQGVLLKGKVKKTRLTTPLREFDYFLPYDEETNPSDYGGVIEMGLKKGILAQNGHSVDVINPETGEVIAEKAVKRQKTNPARRSLEEDKLVENHPEILNWLEEE